MKRILIILGILIFINLLIITASKVVAVESHTTIPSSLTANIF